MNDNRSSDNDPGKSNTGFAGFDSMVTDNLDKTIADVFQGKSDKKTQEGQGNVSKQIPSQSTTPLVDNPNLKRKTTPPLSTQSSHDTTGGSTTVVSQLPNAVKTGDGRESSPPSQLKKWIWGICAILFAIYMSSLFSKNSSERRKNFENTTYSVPSSSLTTDYPSTSPPKNRSNPNSISSGIGQNKTINQLTQEKPPVGTDRVLSRNQIRYCLSEKIRLDAAEEKINNYLVTEVNRFNGMIDDYNNRCSKFRYRSGALEAVRAEVEDNRQNLAVEGRLRFVSVIGPSSSIKNNEKPQPKKPDATILSIQKKLNTLKYNAGPADGIIGMKTTAAIKAFQSDQNLFIDGVASSLLVDQLKNAAVNHQTQEKIIKSSLSLQTKKQSQPSQVPLVLQEAKSKEELSNLKTCLDGNYPASCKHNLLTPEEVIQVSAAERRVNLKTCLDGNYPASCKHNLLTPEEVIQVSAAERRVNLKTCLDGNYPASCKHNLLTPEEVIQVSAAERRVNLKTCLDGNYPASCKHNLLTPEEVIQVSAAERRVNLKTCLDGNYPASCKHNLLTPEEVVQVSAAERR